MHSVGSVEETVGRTVDGRPTTTAAGLRCCCVLADSQEARGEWPSAGIVKPGHAVTLTLRRHPC